MQLNESNTTTSEFYPQHLLLFDQVIYKTLAKHLLLSDYKSVLFGESLLERCGNEINKF